jgi:hypothetical protein
MNGSPEVRCYCFYPNTIEPRAAYRDAGGFLPHRPVQDRDAVTLATGFGWRLFSPVDCQVMWDGNTIHHRIEDGEWFPVNDAVGFPGWPEGFYNSVPKAVPEVPPPAFQTALPEQGLPEHGLPEQGPSQVNAGVIARAASGLGLLIRRPPNVPAAGSLDHLEGIINPSIWFGSLLINPRITKTDTPIRLYPDRPLAQGQPIPLGLLHGDAKRAEVRGLGPLEWADYAASFVDPAKRPDRAHGEYGVKARRDRENGTTCPVAQSDSK